MQFSTTLLAALFLTSTAFASALPQAPEDNSVSLLDSAGATNGTEIDADTGIDDNLDGTPDFDPLELSQSEDSVKVEERSLYDSSEDLEERHHLEARATAAQKIVKCAYSYKGTKYLFGGCKSSAPFGPAKGGMDCSCLSRTCIKKGTGTTIPRTTKTQYPTKAGKCHKVARKSAKPGDMIFWGCKGSSTSGIHHVGIYSKKGYVTHAPHTGSTVREVKIWTSEICPSVVRCW